MFLLNVVLRGQIYILIYLHLKFHVSNLNDLWFITIKSKAEKSSHAAFILFFAFYKRMFSIKVAYFLNKMLLYIVSGPCTRCRSNITVPPPFRDSIISCRKWEHINLEWALVATEPTKFCENFFKTWNEVDTDLISLPSSLKKAQSVQLSSTHLSKARQPSVFNKVHWQCITGIISQWGVCPDNRQHLKHITDMLQATSTFEFWS